MTYKLIEVGKGIHYISDIPQFKKDLPDNIYLDKVNTGAGFTSAVLQNDVNYVLALPFKALGDNKLIQARLSSKYKHELFMYHSGVENVNLKLKEYLERNKDKIKKIMVTYDSLPKLKSFIDFKEYKLAIDEGHKLLEYAGTFKPKVIHNLFEELPNFRAYIVATATPTREEYIPVQLKDTEKIKLVWEEATPVTFKHRRLTQSVLADTLLSLALSFYRKEAEGNVYIFLNSVTDIVKLVKTLVNKFKLSSEDIKIICADSPSNIRKIATIGSGWKPKPVIEEECPDKFYKINFITSTAFEGQDFLDPDGVTYIVSDGRLEHTKLDISTQVSQIVGRLRVSKYRDTVNMLWTQSPIGEHKTEESYEKYVDMSKEEAEIILSDFQNANSLRTKALLAKGLSTDIFFIDTTTSESPEVILNPNAKNHLMNNFIGTGLQYYVVKESGKKSKESVSFTLRDVFTGEVSDNLFIPILSPLDRKKLKSKSNFSEMVKQYLSAKKKLYEHDLYVTYPEDYVEYLKDIILFFETNDDYSLIVDYINIFGHDDKILELSYGSLRPQVLKEKITKHHDLQLLKDILKSKYKKGDILSNEDLKQEFKRVSETYSLTTKFKISDINSILKFTTTSVTLEGKKYNAIKIVTFR